MKASHLRQHEKNLKKAMRATERMERKASRGMDWRPMSAEEWVSQPRRWCHKNDGWVVPAVEAGKQVWVPLQS